MLSSAGRGLFIAASAAGTGEVAIVGQLVAWKSGDDIVQEIQGLQDRREIWRFTEICQDSFLWRTEVSRNGGASWFVEQEIRAKKRRTA